VRYAPWRDKHRAGIMRRMAVIGIGGCASVGKTTLAGALAQRLHLLDVVHVDDLRTA
jgi:2-phosphoglycerate kinase